MKNFLIILVCFFTSNCFAQYHQQHLLENSDDSTRRTLFKAENQNSGSHGFTGFQQISGNAGSEVYGSIVTYNMNYSAIPDYNGYISILSGGNSVEGRGINLIGQKSYANIRFFLGGLLASDMKMILSNTGNLGIGASTPNARLQVTDGDVYIEDINKGVIMKSPDGNCWRITVNNSGALISTATACP